MGRQVRWFRPGMGRLQRRKLVDALLEIRPELGIGARRAADLPLRGVDRAATIVALSPLLDPRPVSLMLDLHDSGYDVVVLWCEPDVSSIHQPATRSAGLARRLWELERHQWRRRLTSAGIPIASWSGEGSLTPVLSVLDRRQRTVKV